ncbi:glycoside hydrolase family 88 protein [Bisporella sp. PMI_857]|nr:glycoside hydrolase family 88 protein [Bisporella sp. PMI_857]
MATQMIPQKRAISPLESQRRTLLKSTPDNGSLKSFKSIPDSPAPKTNGIVPPPTSDTSGLSLTLKHLKPLYSESTISKVWGIAQRALSKSAPPTLYPEYTKPGGTSYVYRESDFWTSGFFPGSLYLLLERQRRYPQFVPPLPNSGLPPAPHPFQLEYACRWWTLNLHRNSLLTTTHDLSFMISPWARKAWDLDHDQKSYETLIAAARTLATRYNPVTQCLRSWDTCVTKRYSFLDPNLDFLVIIDNMLNLDLLFWAAAELRDPRLRDIAIAHAKTTQQHHIRSDSSTFHVVNFDQSSGAVKAKMTNQGYSDDSCWSRGQAWAILGFVQTYTWTNDVSFLGTARSCANYFLEHLPSSGIPPWDFSAPFSADTPTDTSAAVIACYGLLLLHEALVAGGEQSQYLQKALHLLGAVCSTNMSPPAKFQSTPIEIPSVEHGVSSEAGELEVDMSGGAETILVGATINNYEFAPRRWANHGLVYADYYFLLVGNKLLDMGFGPTIVLEGS